MTANLGGSGTAERAIGLSAVVATLGRLDCLGACLGALRESSVPYLETIVVHQGDDPQVSALAEGEGARYVRLAVRGLSRARNHGIALARGTWVFFPDDDCIPNRDFALEITRFFAKQPELRFACGRVHDEHGTVLAPAMGSRAYPIRTRRDVLRGVVSAGLVVERAALETVGGFDERLGVGAEFPSAEESDLVFRLLEAGYVGAYLPEAAVVHAEPHAVRSAVQRAERAFHYGRGWGALFAKHAAGAHGREALALFAEYLARAAAGAALAALRGRSADAARYRASLRGRWRGFRDWRRTSGFTRC